MKTVFKILFCVFVLLQFFVGNSNGFHISQLWSRFKDNDEPTLNRDKNLEVVSLKTIMEKFKGIGSPEANMSNFKYEIVHNPIREDADCDPGFKRDRRGVCREVW